MNTKKAYKEPLVLYALIYEDVILASGLSNTVIGVNGYEGTWE